MLDGCVPGECQETAAGRRRINQGTPKVSPLAGNGGTHSQVTGKGNDRQYGPMAGSRSDDSA